MTDFAFAAVQEAAQRRAPHMHQSVRLPQIADDIVAMAGRDARKAQVIMSALLQLVAARTETP